MISMPQYPVIKVKMRRRRREIPLARKRESGFVTRGRHFTPLVMPTEFVTVVARPPLAAAT